jgi:hypothetical protein
MNMLYMQKYLSPMNCMRIESETGKRRVVVPAEAATWRLQKQPRGASKSRRVAEA